MSEMNGWAEWQKEYSHGVVLIWPPDEIRSQINALRARYDPVSQSCAEAHVSLTPPFLHAPSEQDWVKLRRVAAGHTRFDIAFGPVSAFGLSVIYLEVHPLERLEDLRSSLLATGLFARALHKDFVPHMTITEGLSSVPVSQDLLAELRRSTTGGSFHCDRLAYIRPDQNFHFEVERFLELG
jgi:2'-5' RNA ligase